MGTTGRQDRSMMEKERTIPVLYLVVPCYNEEEVIEKSSRVLAEKIRRLMQSGRIAAGSKVMFVNDGKIGRASCRERVSFAV